MKNFFFTKINFFDFLLLLASFVYGNLFVIDNSKVTWNFLIIFCIIFFLEFLNKLIYLIRPEDNYKKTNASSDLQNEKSPPRKVVFFSKISLVIKMQFLEKNRRLVETILFTNTLKRGFLLGFFVEAFKVGS